VVQRAGHVPIEVGAAETLCRYLARRAELGLDCAATAPLITDLRGQPLTVERLEAYYRAARTVRVSLEANGLFCRTLLTVSQPTAGERAR
jgi:hypothetical protein